MLFDVWRDWHDCYPLSGVLFGSFSAGDHSSNKVLSMGETREDNASHMEQH
jgi:hypothetical protein